MYAHDAKTFREKVQAASELSIANANFLAAKHSSMTVDLVSDKFAVEGHDVTEELQNDFEALLSFDELLTYHEFRKLRPLWISSATPYFDEWKFDLD